MPSRRERKEGYALLRANARTARKQKPRWKRCWDWIIVVLGIGMMLFGGLIFINPWLESLDAQWVSCTVTSAEAATASGGGRAVRTSRPMVKIQTQQCGEVGIFNEITSDNQQQIASELKPGQTYEFEMGWLSQRAAEGVWVFDWMFDSEAKAFRAVSS